MRKKYIVGNWKMFKTEETAQQDFSAFKALVAKLDKCDIGVCPPFVFLNEFSSIKKSIHLYAQNTHWEKEGAFTGEVSIPMLKSLDVDGSLIAHSERRQYFNETNSTAGKKLNALFSNKMRAIYCVGESLEEREQGLVFEVIKNQIQEAFSECDSEALNWIKNSSNDLNSKTADTNNSPLSIAYEPVWAIGTGKAATPQDAHDVHYFIRTELAKVFDEKTANCVRILYGGSVKPNNIKSFINDKEIDGALVGAASLNPQSFYDLCAAV